MEFIFATWVKVSLYSIPSTWEKNLATNLALSLSTIPSDAYYWSRAPELQEKLLYRDKKVKGNSTWSGREERAQPLHLRQRRRQEGSATLIKEKEQWAKVLKIKDKRGL